MAKTQEYKVTIEMQWNTTKRAAYDKLKSWLEHYGHTSTGHGFEFKELSNVGDNE